MMKNIIYRITYIPHLNTSYPKYYIGSKYDYKGPGTYYGSVSSVQLFDYTDKMSLKDWWKREVKFNNEFFDFEILKDFKSNITPKELVIEENKYQSEYNVLNDDYFNQSIATLGFCSTKKSEETKRKISESTKKYWDSESGNEKRERLIKRNKSIQSTIMTELWKNPTLAMLNRKASKGYKHKSGLKRNRKGRRCLIEGVEYKDAHDASLVYNINPVNVRRRCRKQEYKNWSYVYE